MIASVFWSYVAFDGYVNRIALELISATLRSEAASIQQGNLLQAITKLQSAVLASENLKGIVVYGTKTDNKHQTPLLTLGAVPAFALADTDQSFARVGLFSRIYQRKIGNGKSIFFYFNSDTVRWSFIIATLILISFAITVGASASRITFIRTQERALALVAVSEQVSHDIKSPLSALKMVCGIMQSRGVDTDLMNAAIGRIEGILDDLQRQRNPIFNNFDLIKAASDVAREKGVEHPDQCFEQLLSSRVYVSGSETEFKRVLSNILNNAVEANSLKKPIVISSNIVGSKIKVSITDEGCGISDDVQKRLFRRGFTTGKSYGNGLGLYHARNIVRAMGGEVDIFSQQGKGTRVDITLPLS